MAIKDFYKMICSFSDTPFSRYRQICGSQFRVLASDFLNNITDLKWRGYSYNDILASDTIKRILRFRIVGNLIRIIEKKLSKRILFKSEYMSMGYSEEKFISSAVEYIKELIIAFKYDISKIVVLNQPFNVNAVSESMKYFENPKAIIVDRDPRDIYVLAKKYLKSNGSFIPSDDVEEYIKYHRLVRRNNEEYDKDSRVLRLNFEEMIYDYKNATAKVMNFLELNYSNHNQFKYFDPQKSVNNTRLFCRYSELSEDIKRIELALPEYLFCFEKYPIGPQSKSAPF